MKQELWRDIPSYTGIYQASNLSRIRRIAEGIHIVSGGILLPSKTTKGYYRVQLWKDKKVKKKFIHVLIASTWLDNPKGLPEVNHKDGDPGNNKLSNLEWVSKKRNMQHAARELYSLGRPIKATHIASGVITEFKSGRHAADVLNIKHRYISRATNGKDKKSYMGYKFESLPFAPKFKPDPSRKLRESKKVKKPKLPWRLVTEQEYKEQRVNNIYNAIERWTAANLPIPPEWLDELNRLLL